MKVPVASPGTASPIPSSGLGAIRAPCTSKWAGRVSPTVPGSYAMTSSVPDVLAQIAFERDHLSTTRAPWPPCVVGTSGRESPEHRLAMSSPQS